MKKEDFWQDIENSSKINQELSNLKKEISTCQKVDKDLQDMDELLIIAKDDSSLIPELEDNLQNLMQLIDELEIKTLLNGPYDNYNCFLEIHPGAGGTEANDWAGMLLRMYERFCEKNYYQYEVIDYQKGEEAGVKSVTLRIKGYYPYGYFKVENGVHRLVRISPFDANKRRHTSFASVSVIPEFEKVENIDIKDSDLKIDVYHSSGAGGQSVNTSDSAVRITHLPTKIVVSCQIERSQLLNKMRAIEMLKSKLYQLELEKKNEELNKVKGVVSSINFGSQIRNYVLEPYTLVKDLRSGYETSQALKVLDGDILDIMESVLKKEG